MRVNIYAEEITPEVELVESEAARGSLHKTFYGVRFFQKSHRDLHHSTVDDDRSAVTFWVPWTMHDGLDFDLLIEAFDKASTLLKERKADRQPK